MERSRNKGDQISIEQESEQIVTAMTGDLQSYFYFVVTGTGADTIVQKFKSVHTVGNGEGIREYLTFRVHDETVMFVLLDIDTDVNHIDISEKRIIDAT